MGTSKGKTGMGLLTVRRSLQGRFLLIEDLRTLFYFCVSEELCIVDVTAIPLALKKVHWSITPFLKKALLSTFKYSISVFFQESMLKVVPFLISIHQHRIAIDV